MKNSRGSFDCGFQSVALILLSFDAPNFDAICVCVHSYMLLYTHYTSNFIRRTMFVLPRTVLIWPKKKSLAKALVVTMFTWAPFPKTLLCHSTLKDPLPKLHLSHYTMKGFVKGYDFTIGLSQVFSKAFVKPHPCNSILKDPFCSDSPLMEIQGRGSIVVDYWCRCKVVY